MEVIWTWAAEADLQDYFQMSESRVADSGLGLIDQIEAATTLLASFPRLAPAWFTPVRRLIIRKTSLGLFYVPEKNRIVVIALADMRQHPETLARLIRKRLPS